MLHVLLSKNEEYKISSQKQIAQEEYKISLNWLGVFPLYFSLWFCLTVFLFIGIFLHNMLFVQIVDRFNAMTLI